MVCQESMTVKRAVLSTAVAIALGLEIIAPGGEERPHLEKEIILSETEPLGTSADSLRPVVTPPENPWLTDFTLRVVSPEELEGWWVNTATTRSHGLVTVWRTQTCGEVRFKETAKLRNPNLPEGKQESETAIYLNEDYVISCQTRKLCEQIQAWLLQRGVVTQLLLKVASDKGSPPDYRTPLSSYAPVYSDADGVTELPT
jgi:hypothetical protein